jgi:hypothetical protein
MNSKSLAVAAFIGFLIVFAEKKQKDKGTGIIQKNY